MASMATRLFRFTGAALALGIVAASTLAQSQTPPKKLSVIELAARVPEVEEGDSKGRVLETLGRPDRIRPVSTERPESWFYSNSSFTVVLEFERGRVKKKTTTTLVRGIRI